MIPAFNEQSTIGKVIQEIPESIESIDEIQVLVIDDGSDDGTKDAAYAAGADLVVSHEQNLGLAAAFRTGMRTALKMNADIIVNTDADFQYVQSQIPQLIEPILNNEADVVLGSRFKGYIEEMPLNKKIGNLVATLVTRILSGYSTSDAQTGFRAFDKEAASYLRISSTKTYVQETIIRLAHAGFRIKEIPAIFRKRDGKSRLIKNIWRYALEVLPDLLRTYATSVGSDGYPKA
jgi:glycosyltransferase involved in cell wall biosynthesis